jgi:hypothetical protein
VRSLDTWSRGHHTYESKQTAAMDPYVEEMTLKLRDHSVMRACLLCRETGIRVIIVRSKLYGICYKPYDREITITVYMSYLINRQQFSSYLASRILMPEGYRLVEANKVM